MSLLSFLLVLVVIAIVVYGIKLAFEAKWKELIWLVIGVFIAMIILSMLGIRLPDIPTLR